MKMQKFLCSIIKKLLKYIQSIQTESSNIIVLNNNNEKSYKPNEYLKILMTYNNSIYNNKNRRFANFDRLSMLIENF